MPTSAENHVKQILEGLSYVVKPWTDKSVNDPANVIYSQMSIERMGCKKSFVADFALPWAKIDIEADGNWWHESAIRKIRDKNRDNELRQYGWQILRISESTIQKRPDIASRQLNQGINRLLQI